MSGNRSSKVVNREAAKAPDISVSRSHSYLDKPGRNRHHCPYEVQKVPIHANH